MISFQEAKALPEGAQEEHRKIYNKRIKKGTPPKGKEKPKMP